MTLSRPNLLAFIAKIRRELDDLERAVRGTPAPQPSSTSRPTPSSPSPRVTAPQRRQRRRQFSDAGHPPRQARGPVTTKVACDACRDFCWENCPCSCHQQRHAGVSAAAR
jgi:hypothetical protein